MSTLNLANLLTLAAYARKVGTSRQAIQRRVEAGTMQAVLVGEQPFIDISQYPPEAFEKSKGGRPKKSTTQKQ